MSYEREYIVHWVGAILLVLSIGAVIVAMIVAGNTYGNQLGKKCIQNKGSWVLKDAYRNLYECHND
jgi:hypothetical protein